MNRDYGDETDYDYEDDNFYDEDEDDIIYWDEIDEEDDEEEDEEDFGGALILNHPYPKGPSRGDTMKIEKNLIFA